MPIERRIREGAERNAGVLDPDVDSLPGHRSSVETRRRQVVRRSLTGAAAAAAVALAVFVGPSVLDGIEGANGNVPGGNPTPSVAPSVPPIVPFLTGTFTRSIPHGNGGGQGQRPRRHVDDQCHRRWERFDSWPRMGSTVRGPPRRSRCRRPSSGPTRSAPTSVTGHGVRDVHLVGPGRIPADLRGVGSVRRADRGPHPEAVEDWPVSDAVCRAASALICPPCQPHDVTGAVERVEATIPTTRRYAHASSNPRCPRRDVVGRGGHPRCPVRVGLPADGSSVTVGRCRGAIALGRVRGRGARAVSADVLARRWPAPRAERGPGRPACPPTPRIRRAGTRTRGWTPEAPPVVGFLRSAVRTLMRRGLAVGLSDEQVRSFLEPGFLRGMGAPGAGAGAGLFDFIGERNDPDVDLRAGLVRADPRGPARDRDVRSGEPVRGVPRPPCRVHVAGARGPARRRDGWRDALARQPGVPAGAGGGPGVPRPREPPVGGCAGRRWRPGPDAAGGLRPVRLELRGTR